MMRRFLRTSFAAALALSLSLGCNSAALSGDPGNPPDDPAPVEGVLDVQPSALQIVDFTVGQTPPTVVYTATWNGQPASASWGLDRGEIGILPGGPAPTQTFTPRGTTGGMVTLRIGYSGKTVTRQVFVRVSATQSGPTPGSAAEQAQVATSVAQLTASGGIGGVGGEGLGPAVTDPALLNLLANPTSSGAAQGLTFLYPYDKTVWPRGLLAPNLMWQWNTNNADAIQIELSTTSGSYSWKGTFGRPAILATTGGAFVRHPIPQTAWEAATNSAGGTTPSGQPDRLTVKLTIARGGMSYGPISQTWTVAPARLSGIIYYQSYGTLLARNYTGAVGGDGRFGGAVLSIRVGDSGPKLAAGANGTDAQCRTCHSVAANGSQLVVQHGDNYGRSSAYALTPTGTTERAMAVSAEFPGLSPDGSMALSPSGQLISLTNGGTALSSSGLAAVASNLGAPAFAPNGNLIAFNPMASGSLGNPTQKLLVMDFNPMTRVFSNPLTIVDDTGKPAETRPGWPAVFPDSKSVVFHHQSAAGLDGNGLGAMNTRKGARAEIAWAAIGSPPVVTHLNALNGKDAAGTSYLPKLATPMSISCMADGAQVGNIDADHGQDTSLNYEPTVNPVASGGYAWVVITSRRMYGNLATLPPYCSDPRGVNLVNNITTKKLWVAAIDINGNVMNDASHPAFYLPAQELLAGNARGFWTLDPCRADGASCASGDQCCNGFCQPNATDGSLQCSSSSSSQCSAVQEKCTTKENCCDQNNVCINGFCTQLIIG
jgi:hypothetical protein